MRLNEEEEEAILRAQVLLPYPSPHTSSYVSSYYICVRRRVYMCPYTSLCVSYYFIICVLRLNFDDDEIFFFFFFLCAQIEVDSDEIFNPLGTPLGSYVCSSASSYVITYVSSYVSSYYYICVYFIPLYVWVLIILYLYTFILYICIYVLILLYMCGDTSLCVCPFQPPGHLLRDMCPQTSRHVRSN